MKNYYEVLGLQYGASEIQIKEAYKDLVKVWHPDRFSHDPKLQQKAQEKLKEINEAYGVLIRAALHQTGRPARPSAPQPFSSVPAEYTEADHFRWPEPFISLMGILFAIVLLGLTLKIFENSIMEVRPKNSMELIFEK
jgi:hypothetical protein